jgi:hypothetical protein
MRKSFLGSELLDDGETQGGFGVRDILVVADDCLWNFGSLGSLGSVWLPKRPDIRAPGTADLRTETLRLRHLGTATALGE